ncbi:GntR family transcriptional regulator [Luteipulveratus flavus]|uniref:GntR family transcriptional regulator n=1 Tax=Luteipulveratus flavus TaxID=3031728 RepID=A0ABT6C4Q5_9MICO|nr:GntR family transcriptional regulator [Luteipulveratus sp. YIM 133296]MDF8263725.1 GntR family transcriptional regulator [Luteipulveratus sp. YIM 133296]
MTLSMRTPLEPVLRPSTASMVADRVREAIATGDLAPGTQLGEAELARQLGVSRGPLREGLQRLTQEGLLLSIRNRGLFVIEMTPERVRDMYLARQAVERAAAEQVHQRRPVDAGEALLTVIEQMALAGAADDEAGLAASDLQFHELLVEQSESPRLAQMHATLLTETRMCLNALKATYASHDERVDEHRAIARSFIDGEPRLTDSLLVAHMRDALARLHAE